MTETNTSFRDHPIAAIVATVIWAVILLWVLSIALLPTAMAYSLLGWKWAAVTLMATVPTAAFLARAAELLLGRMLARAVEREVEALSAGIPEEIENDEQ